MGFECSAESEAGRKIEKTYNEELDWKIKAGGGKMEKKKCTAVVLAAGRGKRMGTKIQKQYLLLADKPVLYYSLKAFQDAELIDDIYLVTGCGDEQYCREQIVEKYGIRKVSHILCGGMERYHSVWNALKEMGEEGYVFIHDGARPFIDENMIYRAYSEVEKSGACVVGMPVKDTIKIADCDQMIAATPERSKVWMVQTPQVFETALVKRAYAQLMESGESNVTDDAMVVEQMSGHPVKLVEGSYKNIKITTPEDLEIGELFVRQKTNLQN